MLFITFIFISRNYHQLYNISYNLREQFVLKLLWIPNETFLYFL